MAAKLTHTNRAIVLTPHFDRFVRAKVKSGRYRSASEVVRDGLRLLEEQERLLADLRSEIELGWQQSERGEVVPGPAVFAEIRSLSKARHRAAKSQR